jgi:hypothetical protein
VKRSKPTARTLAIAFAILPCVVGVGLGLVLNGTGTIWLSDTRGVWPIVCLGSSLAAMLHLVMTREYDRVVYASLWLLIAWTWLYVPLWLTAPGIPRTWAVVGKDGTVHIAGEWAPSGVDTVWVLSGRRGNRIVRNVEGAFTTSAVDVLYRFSKPYLATRGPDEDLSVPVVGAVTAALAAESKGSRLSRSALFEVREAQDRFVAGICRSVVKGGGACPLELTFKPQNAAVTFGGVWSKQFTEAEAIEERNLPTLVQLLTLDNSRLVARDRVFGLFLALAETAGDLAKVARKPGLLDDAQFDEVIRRILLAPDAGSEALGLAADVPRLRPDQREALRAKAFREANIGLILRQSKVGRVSDEEVAGLGQRMRAAFAANPEVAVLALEVFGARLPREVQSDAVAAIATARAPHAIAALRHLNFVSDLRKPLLDKVIAEASLKELDASLSRDKLDDIFTPAELRRLVASVVARTSSKDWLEFAVKVLPMRAMTAEERKRLVDEVLFTSSKAALELVSENRQHLDPADVNAVTVDYARTIARDMCLHLTHRNANRKIDYFSDAQIAIFERCAQQ